MAASLPGRGARGNRPERCAGQTKVDAGIDRSRFPCAPRVPTGCAMIDQRRRRLVDLAFVATALVTGAASFSNQARQGGWPGWAVVAGTAGGIAACAALWF